MHERDEPKAGGFPFRFLRHRAEREAVGEHDAAVVDRRESATGVSQCLRRRRGKGVVQFADGDRPTSRRQAGDHASIVTVASGEGVDTARDQQDE